MDAHFYPGGELYPHPLGFSSYCPQTTEKKSRHYFIQSESFINSRTAFCFTAAHNIEMSELNERAIRESRRINFNVVYCRPSFGIFSCHAHCVGIGASALELVQPGLWTWIQGSRQSGLNTGRWGTGPQS